jgi:hypothetical protein
MDMFDAHTVGDHVVIPSEAGGFPYRFFVVVIGRYLVATSLARTLDSAGQ